MTKNLLPQVAFLTTDFKVAKEVGQIFKKLDIVIDTFLSVEDFLISHIHNKFDLILLDINHALYEGKPLIFRRELANTEVAFYFNDLSKERILPTYSVEHLGYVNANANLNANEELLGQVKNILVRYNKVSKLKADVQNLKTFQANFTPKQEMLLKTNENLKMRLSHSENIIKILNKISSLTTSTKSFGELLNLLMSDLEMVHSVAFMELAQDGQRLLNNFEGPKKFNIPAIWLGKKNKEVDEYAYELTQNMAQTLSKKPVINLQLKDANNKVQALLVMEIDGDYIFNFDWKLVESSLSAIYFIKTNSNQEKLQDKILSSFELFNRLNSRSNSNEHILSFDLSDIIDFKNLRSNIVFDWAEFWKDLSLNLVNIISDGDIYTLTYENVVVVVDDFIFEESFAAAKEFCQRLSLSKYFSGLEFFESNAAKIKVREVPYSEFALLKEADKQKQKNKKEVSI